MTPAPQHPAWRKTIPAAERASVHVLPILLALAWTGGCGFFFVLMLLHGRGTTFVDKLVVLAPVAIGLLLLWWQVRKFFRLLGEGTALLELQDAPPTLGGRLKALLLMPGRAGQASHVMVELACVRDGDGSRVAPNVYSRGTVWTSRREVAVTRQGGYGTAALEFEIPADCLPTGKWESGRKDDKTLEHDIGWQVRVSAVAGRELVDIQFDLAVRQPRVAQPPVGVMRDAAAIALIVANLFPIALMFAGRADVASLAYLYWAENLVIACYMALRVLYAGRGEAVDKLGCVAFFAVWIGGVSVFLGRVMIGMLLNPPRDWDPPSILGAGAKVVRTIGAHLVESGMVLTVLAFFVSHGLAFRKNYLANGRYLLASANHEIEQLMQRGVITFGVAFVVIGVASLDSPRYVLAALVIAKTGYELWRYSRDRHDAPGMPAASRV